MWSYGHVFLITTSVRCICWHFVQNSHFYKGLSDQKKAFDHFSFGSFLNFLPTERVSRAKGVLTRVVRLAQKYLLDPMGRQKTEEKGSQTQTKPKQHSPAPGRVVRSRTSTSMTRTQVKVCFKLWLCSLFHFDQHNLLAWVVILCFIYEWIMHLAKLSGAELGR